MSQTKAQLIGGVGISTAEGLVVSGIITATSFNGNLISSGIGSVGVGTVNPRSRLDVAGDITIRRTDSSFEGGQITFTRSLDDIDAYSIDVYGNTGGNARLRFLDVVSGAERATLDRAGNFIIGTGSSTGTSSQPLQVTGGFYVSGNAGIGTTNPTSKLDLFGSSTQSIVAIAASDINCSLGNYFTDTVNGSKTYTVSGIVTNRVYSFTLEVTHTTGTITWFSNLEWPGGTAPTLTTGKTHLFMFVTDDGGSRWRGSSLINYTN